MKKNFRKIPEPILLKVQKSPEDEWIVFGIMQIATSDIVTGKYKYLQITMDSDKPNFPNEIIPNEKQGHHSNWNINGREIKRKDMPKETYSIYIESPNWGDSSNGTHTVEWEKERYPVEFIAPRCSTIKIELLKSLNDKYIFKFSVSEILNRKSNDFKDRLFDCINLLQENIGVCDIAPSNISSEQYLNTYKISWEILPPGEKEKVINKLFSGRRYTLEEKKTAEGRYDFFLQLKPKEMIIGVSGFQRYFGAKIDDNLVLFENTDYGNALYIMYENWEELSKKSRIELLSGKFGTNFDRVIHRKGWKNETKEILNKKRKKK
jgi:hypothetical protein